MGGGMRQAGILAAAGRYALAHHIDRLAEDHVRARRLADALEPFGVIDPDRVRTNIVVLDLAKAPLDAQALAAAARSADVLVSVLGPRTARLLTHLDLEDADIDQVIEVLTAIFRDASRG
jgi:threonine aldolase